MAKAGRLCLNQYKLKSSQLTLTELCCVPHQQYWLAAVMLSVQRAVPVCRIESPLDQGQPTPSFFWFYF